MASRQLVRIAVLALAAWSYRLPAQPPSEELTRDELAVHVLGRLTFGPRPGDLDRILAIGVDRWIETQLRPEAIPDTAAMTALAALPGWGTTPPNRFNGGVAGSLRLDTAAIRIFLARSVNEIPAGRVARADVGERQLLEVMTDFWENHFSLFGGKLPTIPALLPWDSDIIRPRALGKFRDLLGAVAHSPQMLWYLDNYLSTADALNENYARELLELHTMGVDGGYTQQDVIDVARAFTGWTIGAPERTGPFLFREAVHDADDKTVLGRAFASGRGIDDGEEVLDLLARHPATAHFIARKLAIRFVSDSPSLELVDRAAATFLRSDGDIREVVRTIVMSPEFRSRPAFRAKVKSPFEYVESVRRLFGAPRDTAQETLALVSQLGQPIFGHETPEGWPEIGSAWITAGAMFTRVDIGLRIGRGELASVPIEHWWAWGTLCSMPFDGQVDYVVRHVLGGVVSRETKAVLLTARPAPAEAATKSGREATARELIGLALSSAEFQQR